MASKIKKGDKVIVLAGRSKGVTGEVTSVDPRKDQAFVQGVNLVKRHQSPTQFEEGGIKTKEAPIHLSNLALVDPKDGKATRVGFSVVDGKKIRVSKRSGEALDG